MTKCNKIKNIKSKRGSALAETILVIAISLVLVIIIFYPQITTLFNSLLTTLSTWFNNSISILGTVN